MTEFVKFTEIGSDKMVLVNKSFVVAAGFWKGKATDTSVEDVEGTSIWVNQEKSGPFIIVKEPVSQVVETLTTTTVIN